MSPERQEAIGVAAIDYWIMAYGAFSCCSDEHAALEDEAMERLETALDVFDPETIEALGDDGFPLPSFAEEVRRCMGCGCTEHRACEGGCSWVAPRLCSRCAGSVVGGQGSVVGDQETGNA